LQSATRDDRVVEEELSEEEEQPLQVEFETARHKAGEDT